MDENKAKALDAALTQIRKDHGAGAIMKLGEATDINIETIPTGSIGLEAMEEFHEAGLLRFMDLNQAEKQPLPCI